MHSLVDSFIFKNFFLNLFIFRDRGKEGEGEGEKHRSVASHMPTTRDPAHNPGMCPDQELLGSQAGTQSTESHQPGHWLILVCALTAN